MKRVVVTGAAGFIGANVARRLLDDGYEPTLLTGPGSDCWRLAEVEGSAPVVQLDLADGDAVATVVSAARPEWILHLAAHGAYSWQTDRAAILRTNVVGTANLLEAARRADVEAFVNTGSSSEYGLKEHCAGRGRPASSRTARTPSPRRPPRCSVVTSPLRTGSTFARCGCTRRTAHGKSPSA